MQLCIYIHTYTRFHFTARAEGREKNLRRFEKSLLSRVEQGARNFCSLLLLRRDSAAEKKGNLFRNRISADAFVEKFVFLLYKLQTRYTRRVIRKL